MKMEDMEMPEMKPRLHLTSEDVESLPEWEVGNKYTVLVEIKMVSKAQREEEEMCGDFEVEKIKELPKTKGSFSKEDVTVAMDMKKLDYLR